jgi:glycosyltransferase involved in cell wall biosynthesis
MPVVEALAAGVPVACSAIEPLSTISGAAALHFDPESTDAIRDALVRVTSDEPLRSRLAVEGPLRAAGFSWREAAARTLKVLVQAAGG